MSYLERLAYTTDLRPCSICKRRFAPDRIEIHEEYCVKNFNVKRTPYVSPQKAIFVPDVPDTAKTDEEPQSEEQNQVVPATKSLYFENTSQPVLTTNWRSKHESFLHTIKLLKSINTSVKNTNDDLPYPPAVDCDEYSKCPYCMKKFNKAAFERHTSICASVLSKKVPEKVE